MSAALAFFALFSLAPLIVILVQVAALVLGAGHAGGHHTEARTILFNSIRGSLGRPATDFVASIVDGMVNQQKQGLFASVLSWAVLLLGALGLVGALQDALNAVWNARPRETGIWAAIRNRLLSLITLAIAAAILIGTVVVSTGLSALTGDLPQGWPLSDLAARAISIALTFAICTVLFALIFKFLPSAVVAWRDAFIGAGVTAALYVIGQYVLGWYLGRASTASAYGAAGSLVVIILWIYYNAQIVLIGAEFTKAFASRYGEKIVSDDALPDSPKTADPISA